MNGATLRLVIEHPTRPLSCKSMEFHRSGNDGPLHSDKALSIFGLYSLNAMEAGYKNKSGSSRGTVDKSINGISGIHGDVFATRSNPAWSGYKDADLYEESCASILAGHPSSVRLLSQAFLCLLTHALVRSHQ